MSKFGDELSRVFVEKSLVTEDTVRKLSEEDQRALVQFATQIVRVWLEDGTLNEEDLAALWVTGFAFGHNWVKEHWALW